MRNKLSVGHNRSGIESSPLAGHRAERATHAHDGAAAVPLDEITALRAEYTNEARPLGSVPPPVSVKGAAKVLAQWLHGEKGAVLIDKLGERLAFERTGVRLYEAVLAKYEATGSWNGGPTREHLAAFHEDELRHFALLRQALSDLGADPTAVTPSADVAAVASLGVVKIITDPRTNLAQCLQGLLIAELTDHDGWDLLIKIAESLGQHELTDRCREALGEEENHLAHVRSWLAAEALAEANMDVEETGPDVGP